MGRGGGGQSGESKPGATVPRGLRVGEREAEGVKAQGRGGFSDISISPHGQEKAETRVSAGGGRRGEGRGGNG